MSFLLQTFRKRRNRRNAENDMPQAQHQAGSQLEGPPSQNTRMRGSLDEPKNGAPFVQHIPRRLGQGQDMVDGNPRSHRNDPVCEHQLVSDSEELMNENHPPHGLQPTTPQSLQDPSGRQSLSSEIIMNLSETPPANKSNGRDLHLLSIEGRGICSLATLIILKEVLQHYQYLQNLPQLPRPCDVFDLAGGTGSGGIIVIMLFRLGMTVDEAITAYTMLSEEVFFKKAVLRSHSETDASLLESAFAKVIDSSLNGGKSQAQKLCMLDDNGPKCFVSASTARNLSSTLFRTYVTSHHASNCTIVDAITATTAEVPFFDEKVKETFNHRASRIGNSLKSVLEEASIFPGQFISCVLSIGSGPQGIADLETTSTKELAKALNNIVNYSEISDEGTEEFSNKEGFYCRLNVDHDDSGLEDWARLGEVRLHTQNYLEKYDVTEKVSRLAQVLNKRTAVARTVEETLPVLNKFLVPSICHGSTESSDMHLTRDGMSEALAYASRHWATHLVKASKFDDEEKRLLEHIVRKQLLAWQQSVPRIMGKVDPAYSTLDKFGKLYGSKTTISITPTTLLDGCRFIALNIESFNAFPCYLLPAGPLNSRSVPTFGELKAGYKATRNPTGSILSFMTEHAEGVSFVISSEDGMKLASASYGGTVRLWDAQTGDEVAVLREHSGSINSVAFSPDGTKLASASFDETVRVWNGQTGAEIAVLRSHSGSVNSVVFSPIGTKLASASSDETVRLWDGQTFTEVNVLRGHSDSVESVVFSPDGTKLASTSLDGTMRLWDAQSGAEVILLHLDSVESVMFSSDGTKLALASYDGMVQLWDSQTGDEIARFTASALVGFTLDGARLILMTAEELYQVNFITGDRHAKPLEVFIESDVEVVRVSGSNLWVIRVNQKSLQGLLVVKVDHNSVLHVMPLCLFPPILPVTGFAVPSPSRVVVGCKDGRIILFDTHLSYYNLLCT